MPTVNIVSTTASMNELTNSSADGGSLSAELPAAN